MSHMRTKMLALGTAAAVAVSLAACAPSSDNSSGGAEGGDDRLTIALSVNDTTSFVNEGKDALQAYADARGINLIINDPKGDVATQATQIDQFIRQGVDGIMVIAIAADSLAQQVADAKDAGIPLLNVNSALNNPDTAGGLEPDDVQAGRDIAEAMVAELGGQGNVVVLQGPLANSAQILRDQGINEVLDEHPGIKILAADTAEWSRDQAANKMANWITAFGDEIHGVIAHNDDMALGALQALTEANRELPIVGIDGIQDGLRAVAEGKFLATVLQNGSIELPLALALTVAVIKGEAAENRISFGMPLVTQENIDLYMRHVVTEKDAFIAKVPDIVDRNLASGDYSSEEE